jgi:hypothetical protein
MYTCCSKRTPHTCSGFYSKSTNPAMWRGRVLCSHFGAELLRRGVGLSIYTFCVFAIGLDFMGENTCNDKLRRVFHEKIFVRGGRQDKVHHAGWTCIRWLSDPCHEKWDFDSHLPPLFRHDEWNFDRADQATVHFMHDGTEKDVARRHIDLLMHWKP